MLPVPLYRTNKGMFIDAQACNGLRLWLENFEGVDLFCPEFPADEAPSSQPIEEIIHGERLRIFALPGTYSPITFIRHFPAVVRLFRAQLPSVEFVQVALGGLWGNWAVVAGAVAAREGRAYAVWTDQVASEVMRFQASERSGLRSLYWRFTAALTAFCEKFIISKASVGLFHGASCYSAYARWSKSPHLVHDVHLPPDARIDPVALEAKINTIGGQTRIIYAGRAVAEKGIFDWIDALALLDDHGVNFSAVWYGAGDALEPARGEVGRRGLRDKIHFPGAVEDHHQLMSYVAQGHVFLFCHKIPESPRCLVEALICGTPIIGYHSPYAEDLISQYGGGILTPPNDPAQLSARVSALSVEQLADLSRRAARDGSNFSDEQTFEHRSSLIKNPAREATHE